MSETVQELGWQQMVSMDALRDSMLDIRSLIAREAKRRMLVLADEAGVTMLDDEPTAIEQPLVWVDDWMGQGGEYVSPGIARSMGVLDEPTVVALRYTWRTTRP